MKVHKFSNFLFDESFYSRLMFDLIFKMYSNRHFVELSSKHCLWAAILFLSSFHSMSFIHQLMSATISDCFISKLFWLIFSDKPMILSKIFRTLRTVDTLSAFKQPWSKSKYFDKENKLLPVLFNAWYLPEMLGHDIFRCVDQDVVLMNAFYCHYSTSGSRHWHCLLNKYIIILDVNVQHFLSKISKQVYLDEFAVFICAPHAQNHFVMFLSN